MATGTQTCEVTIPGYVLTDRIGSGGYAEVWRAEAPGGIEKAVKIVRGFYDDELASQELKSLERIKGVRHPFLLSLERFEVVEGRLAILTELADMSLEQRLRQCRAEGLTGIPRDELLQYMADAAEALDFLSQRHSLLHLDIKPENLLVLGDHIKVADFGLVKELASRTQNSLVSGMTPTYASPEMFDDEPSAHSDQYSLAIVYQEMLVGTLPFPGRTAAQLAKQHTQSEPQLMALPADDRPVVARALSKTPTERYPSCRAFVEALLHRAQAPQEIPPTEPRPTGPSPDAPNPDDTKPSWIHTTVRRTADLPIEPRDASVTRPVAGGKRPSEGPLAKARVPVPPVVEETVDVAVPEVNSLLCREQPTLYIGLGGLGIQTLCRLRTLLAARQGAGQFADAIEMACFDTDRNELRDAISARWKWPLPPEDVMHLPLRLPKSYDNSRDILGWVSRRWLYNIPRSLETRGYRPLGRVALVDHSRRVLDLMTQKLARLESLVGTKDQTGAPRDETIKIVVVTGMGGGSGAGMVIDVATAARTIARAHGVKSEIQGVLLCTSFSSAVSSPLVAANTFALLTELNHATQRGNESQAEPAQRQNSFESREAPFDTVYCIPIRSRPATAHDDVLGGPAEYLALDAVPATRAALRSCRAAHTPRDQAAARALVLKKFGCAPLDGCTCELLQDLAKSLADDVKQHWWSKDTSQDWETRVREERQAASVATLEQPASAADGAPAEVVPYNDTTPLALRGRFGKQLSTHFASDTIAQIERRLEARDDRGRPLLLARDAKTVVDVAQTVLTSLACEEPTARADSRFTASPVLRPLVAQASERIVARIVDQCDPKSPARPLADDAIAALVRHECLALLEERFRQSEFRGSLTELLPMDQMLDGALDRATSDLLQCGADRRTLLFAPESRSNDATTQALCAKRPMTATLAADLAEALLVSEDTGISPRSFALGLERVYPGISDAARRLHTRIDVEWVELI